MRGFNERGKDARDNRSHSAGQLAVHNFNLGEVGGLRRTADITQRWQQVILHQWAQQHVRAELLGTSFRLLQQLCRSQLALANKEFSILMPYRGPGPIFKIKTERV